MDRRFALLLACFFLSGFAALLYQTAWTRELSFVFGTSDLAVAAVLAAYMGGLALGAAAASRIASRLRRPVLAYGLLELGVAVCALLVPWEIRAVNALYVALLGGGSALPETGDTGRTLLQLGAAFGVLLPPTAFMGATLPLLARHAVRRKEQIASRVGVLYAVNTAGAIAGTLLAAFLMMPALGLRHTVWSGAAVNAAVFGFAALLARRAPLPPVPAEPPREATAVRERDGFSWVLPAMGLSGAVSFAYEVLWTRLLAHLLGASIHAFATMLASFLLGIALGSAVAARLATTRQRAVLGFTVSQLGIALTSYAVFALSNRLPGLSVSLGAGPASPLASVGVAVAALLPITLCIGATFPFAVRAVALRPEQAAAVTARIYAWNTMGAIAGALGAGFVLLPGLGFEGTLTAGVAANLALAALAALATPPRRRLAAVAAVAGGLALALAPARPPWTLLTSSPMRPRPQAGEITYAAVGRTASVLLIERDGQYHLSTNGLPEASIDAVGMVPKIDVAQWLGVLPVLVRPESRDLLVVGLGGGVALEFMPRAYENVDVIELEPEVVAANRKIAAERARDPLADPRVHVHIGDARGTLQLTAKRYDAIISQPSHPWTAGASHLYTREFFSLVRSHLEPDGVFVQWIGMSFVDEALLRSLLATLLEVFPHVELYRPQTYGMLFVASREPIDGLAGGTRALAAAPADFAPLGLDRLEDFASAWALDEVGVRALAEGATLNLDDRNLLAARSAQLGKAALDPARARALLEGHDPLRDAPGLDRSALVRALTNRGQPERAIDVAMADDGAREEAALGWVELAAGRSTRAARHFERALSIDPGDRDALRGRMASHRFAPTAGGGGSGAEPSVPYAALAEAWRHAQARQWDAVAALDGTLARIRPGDALFEVATRLRVTQRLATRDPEAAAEGEGLAETLLLRHWSPDDALLHARAAAAAGRFAAARGSLQRIAEAVGASRRGRALAARALEVAEALPDDAAGDVRLQLSRLVTRGRRGMVRR